ncbi:hypothetical protein BZA05DRAFT_155610 [Tricharina praecox]|uniref:uncharacterized protein n=1 Tax=Tricharina praecox TaxID=43433 RepID=UPI00221EA442|nr:uncharacterized protein BZA05DRAFT_155610 [Tricharina praecox]KAI5844681.1 hypothetical protein BZA05DRAFT_155610 [Tricharina praecox]
MSPYPFEVAVLVLLEVALPARDRRVRPIRCSRSKSPYLLAIAVPTQNRSVSSFRSKSPCPLEVAVPVRNHRSRSKSFEIAVPLEAALPAQSCPARSKLPCPLEVAVPVRNQHSLTARSCPARSQSPSPLEVIRSRRSARSWPARLKSPFPFEITVPVRNHRSHSARSCRSRSESPFPFRSKLTFPYCSPYPLAIAVPLDAPPEIFVPAPIRRTRYPRHGLQPSFVGTRHYPFHLNQAQVYRPKDGKRILKSRHLEVQFGKGKMRK